MVNAKNFLLLISLFSFLHSWAQSHKLFLVAGQSNAVGVGNADSSTICIPATCFEYISTADSIRPLKDPVGYSATNEDFQAAVTGSAWPAFASTYYQLTGDTVIIVQAAKGGTSCTAAADAGAGNWSSAYHLFTQAAAKAKRAETFTGQQLSGIIWLQGESDAMGINSNKISVCQYEDALIDLIQRFRNAFRCNLPFYIIQTGLYTQKYDSAFSIVRKIQQHVADEDSLTFIADSAAITYRALGWMNADHIHLDQRALNNTGANAAQNIVYIEHHSNLDSCYATPLPIVTAPDWDVFPSPFGDELQLEIRNCNCADIDLQITDMMGRTVYKTKQNILTLSQPRLYIPTASFHKGTYIVRALLNNEWRLNRKVVKD